MVTKRCPKAKSLCVFILVSFSNFSVFFDCARFDKSVLLIPLSAATLTFHQTVFACASSFKSSMTGLTGNQVGQGEWGRVRACVVSLAGEKLVKVEQAAQMIFCPTSRVKLRYPSRCHRFLPSAAHHYHQPLQTCFYVCFFSPTINCLTIWQLCKYQAFINATWLCSTVTKSTDLFIIFNILCAGAYLFIWHYRLKSATLADGPLWYLCWWAERGLEITPCMYFTSHGLDSRWTSWERCKLKKRKTFTRQRTKEHEKKKKQFDVPAAAVRHFCVGPALRDTT